MNQAVLLAIYILMDFFPTELPSFHILQGYV